MRESPPDYVKYIGWQFELTESGNEHIQGYIELYEPQRFSALKKWIGDKSHFESRRGTREEARNYCITDPYIDRSGIAKPKNRVDGPYEYGKWDPIGQGHRTDLEEIRTTIKNGGGMPDVLELARSYQSAKFAELYLANSNNNNLREMEIKYHYGKAGSYKTFLAFNQFPNAWISGRDLKFWDGYNGQKEIILDDFREDFCTFHELLRILDRYPYRVNVKGSSRQLLATTIIITSCKAPKDLYPGINENKDQLYRRLNKVYHHREKENNDNFTIDDVTKEYKDSIGEPRDVSRVTKSRVILGLHPPLTLLVTEEQNEEKQNIPETKPDKQEITDGTVTEWYDDLI